MKMHIFLWYSGKACSKKKHGRECFWRKDVSESLCQQHLKMLLVHPVQIHSQPYEFNYSSTTQKNLKLYRPFSKGDSFIENPSLVRVQPLNTAPEATFKCLKPSSSFTSSTTVISSYIWRRSWKNKGQNFKNSYGKWCENPAEKWA